MKKTKGLLHAAKALSLILLAGVSHGAIIDITAGNGSKIQDAINSANDGDVIRLAPGNYWVGGTIAVTKTVTITALDTSNKPNIIANQLKSSYQGTHADTESEAIFTVRRNNVKFTHLNLISRHSNPFHRFKIFVLLEGTWGELNRWKADSSSSNVIKRSGFTIDSCRIENGNVRVADDTIAPELRIQNCNFVNATSSGRIQNRWQSCIQMGASQRSEKNLRLRLVPDLQTHRSRLVVTGNTFSRTDPEAVIKSVLALDWGNAHGAEVPELTPGTAVGDWNDDSNDGIEGNGNTRRKPMELRTASGAISLIQGNTVNRGIDLYQFGMDFTGSSYMLFGGSENWQRNTIRNSKGNNPRATRGYYQEEGLHFETSCGNITIENNDFYRDYTFRLQPSAFILMGSNSNSGKFDVYQHCTDMKVLRNRFHNKPTSRYIQVNAGLNIEILSNEFRAWRPYTIEGSPNSNRNYIWAAKESSRSTVFPAVLKPRNITWFGNRAEDNKNGSGGSLSEANGYPSRSRGANVWIED